MLHSFGKQCESKTLLVFHQPFTVLVLLDRSSASFSGWSRISGKLLLLKLLNHGVNLYWDDNSSTQTHVTYAFYSQHGRENRLKAKTAEAKVSNVICNGQYAQHIFTLWFQPATARFQKLGTWHDLHIQLSHGTKGWRNVSNHIEKNWKMLNPPFHFHKFRILSITFLTLEVSPVLEMTLLSTDFQGRASLACFRNTLFIPPSWQNNVTSKT